MTPERWQKVKGILDKILHNEPAEIEKILLQTCGDDSVLKAEVLEILALNSQADSFLSSPLVDLFEQSNNPSEIETLNQLNLEQDLLLMKSLIGKTLDGKYLIEKQLGQGGMGAVYKATHLGTNRPVAVKVIMPQFMANLEFIERFRVEAKATGKLQHPNIVNITDFGFTQLDLDNMAYLVMEFLDGYNLGDFLKSRGKLPLYLVVDIVEQICLALNEAHKQGIIHRDLKPDNIWLQPNGRDGYNVKILDFGLARLRDNTLNPSPVSKLIGKSTNLPTNPLNTQVETIAQLPNQQITKFFVDEEAYTKVLVNRSSNNEVKTLKVNKVVTVGDIDPKTVPEWLTRVGIIIGTPLYMSPEQCAGTELDARSDIYSLGIIIYQMLAGETPFSGNTYQLIEKHKKEQPVNLREKRKELPKDVTELVMSTLSKKPEDRPKSSLLIAKVLRLCAKGVDLALLESKEFFYTHYFKFIVPLSIVSLPFLIPYLFFYVIFLVNLHQLADKTLSVSLAESVFDFLSQPYTLTVVFLLWGQIIFGTCLIMIEQLHSNPNSSIKLKFIVKTLLGHFPEIVVAQILSVAMFVLKFIPSNVLTTFKFNLSWKKPWRGHSFKVASILFEEKTRYSALESSQSVVKLLFSFVRSLRSRQIGFWLQAFLVGGIYFVVVLPATANITMGAKGEFSPGVLEMVSIGFAVLMSLLITFYLFLNYIVIAITLSNLYLEIKLEPNKILENISKDRQSRNRFSRSLFTQHFFAIWSNIKEFKLLIGLMIAMWLISINDSFFYESHFIPDVISIWHGISYVQPNYVPDTNRLVVEAVYMGKVETVRWLLEQPKYVDVRTKSSTGKNLLFIAAQSGNLEMVRLLAKTRKGLLLDLPNDQGDSLLIYLVKQPLSNNRKQVIEELISLGANTDLKNREAKTALDVAQETNQNEIIEILKNAKKK
ncbi:MAG: protein kinase [Blastocatellia bacterium]|nr:protein kinase [Blastocatellia bacterium]